MDKLTEAQGLVTELEALHAARAQAHKDMEAQEDETIPDDVALALAAIAEEWAPRFDLLDRAISDKEKEVKRAVIAVRETVKGDMVMAVYTAPRRAWDAKALMGYAAAHPDVLQLSKVRAASVSIRRQKGK